MPNIVITIPHDAYPGDARSDLVRRINDAAATVEQIPDNPRMRALTWVLIEEIQPGGWTCGCIDMSSQALTCLAQAYVPQGVLDQAAKARYVQLMHNAFEHAKPVDDNRRLITSVMLREVDDGAWGANGTVWTLPDLARHAGYAHLQHLTATLDHAEQPEKMV